MADVQARDVDLTEKKEWSPKVGTLVLDSDFYKGKRVLITGHNGFKGSWMCTLLQELGADVTGYSLPLPPEPSLFGFCPVRDMVRSVDGDIRDLPHLMQVFADTKPEIVIHMAAQPLVRTSYQEPVYTYEVNVMGTVNVMECVRQTDSVRSVINVTTDKVYRNREKGEFFREEDELNGQDPYSNSKSCSELVTDAYVRSFLRGKRVSVSTVRAGNVIGGGDFAANRILPDCVRAALAGREICIRNPESVRPFQHVLEPVSAYLMIARRQYDDPELSGSYNIGPAPGGSRTVRELVQCFCECWNSRTGKQVRWKNAPDGGPAEAGTLMLDCGKLARTFGWTSVWTPEDAVEKAVEWYLVYPDRLQIAKCMERQIGEFYESKTEASAWKK